MNPRSELVTRLRDARTVVVKVGSGVLTDDDGRIEGAVLASLAADIASLAADPQRRMLVVSSGAIALGVEALKLSARPKRMDALQACAAAGQGALIRLWSEALAAHGRTAAQVLLTHADFADRQRYLNARGAIDALCARRAIPVINENDTVSVDEIAFGDNDSLSAQVANLVQADVLVMLSVAPGLLDDEGRRVSVVSPGDRGVDRFVRSDTSARGKGGMITKLRAARAANDAGAMAFVASGREPAALPRIFRGEDLGTVFLAGAEKVSARRHWIAHTLRARGTLVVDDGARKALVEGNRSLLPSGVRAVRGDFRRGDPVELEGLDGAPFARGLVAYGALEMERIRGRNTREISELLGVHHGDEAVHKDDLALLG
ncbi:MAG: glutamate 5-kinase [Polyangiales bacterium]